MLPDYLSTSYQKYKADTDYVATWLATTSKQCGFTLEFPPAEPLTQKKEKLKGRARTLARRAAQGDTDPKSCTQKTTYTIAMKQFIPMAECIASYRKTAVKVPKTFVKLLDRAIALRKKVSQAVTERQDINGLRDKDELAGDAKHSYFVNILERIRNVLGHLFPLISEQVRKSPAVVAETLPQVDLANVFECLEVEEPSDIAENEAPHTDAAANPTISYRAEQATDQLEAIFAFSCLLRDLRGIRKVIAKCWQDYKENECDLITAALTSNIAVELARRLEEDIERFATFVDNEKMLNKFHEAHCQILRRNSRYQNMSNQELDSETYDLMSQRLFWSAYSQLKWNLTAVREAFATYAKAEQSKGARQPLVTLRYKPGQFGRYDPLADRQKMSGTEKQQEDSTLMSEILSDMSIFAVMKFQHPHDDEFTRGFVAVYEAGHIPLWLVFAAQILLDVHYILRDKVNSGYEYLLCVGLSIRYSICDQIEYQRRVLKENPPSKPELSFDRVLKFIDAVGSKDWIKDTIQAWSEHLAIYRDVEIVEFRWLKQNPVLCGLKAYVVSMAFHEAALDWANTKTSVIACAHLHNALYCEGLLLSPWKDMVFFLVNQDRDHLFVGDHPKEEEQYHRRFCLAVMGHSPVNFARDRRGPNQIIYASAGHRKIDGQCPVSRALFKRYGIQESRAMLSAQDTLNILGQHQWVWGDMIDRRGVPARTLVLGPRPKAAQRGQDQERSAGKVDMPELLQNVQRALSAEAVEVSFDYLRLHQNCTRVLRAVKEANANHMRDIELSNKEQDLRKVVEHILATLAAERQSAARRGPTCLPGDYGSSGRSMLRAAADSMSEVLNEPSDTVTGRGAGHNRGMDNIVMIKALHRVRVKVDNQESWFNGEFEV